MQVLFLGGPLDGRLYDLEPPLTETVAYTEEGELDTVEDYEPSVRPYFLHTLLLKEGLVPAYSTTPDFLEFGDQVERRMKGRKRITPSTLLPPAHPLSIEAAHEG